ncbi:AAA family ATPase [Nonomuraea sp. NPDC049637]|uniref:nucleotide-binding protein n=1 Tax=Nonomuraea sp. NPDC049637 TaxID=3154356 RepID=UPI00342F4867
MARHDREESLEEQLAWLDAIKETEETPVSVGASSASADEPVASPYPKDPWLLVPTPHDTPTPPLFRAAVDSVYGHAAAEDLPEAESEAGEWLDRAATQESGRGQESGGAQESEPAAPPVSLGRSEDPFLAPLRPLPRPDDTDSYSLTFTPPERAGSGEKSAEKSAEKSSGKSTEQGPEPSREQDREQDREQGEEPVREQGRRQGEEPAGESEEPGWPSLGDWSRPAEQSNETQPMITELPEAFDVPSRTEPPRAFDVPSRTEPPKAFDVPARTESARAFDVPARTEPPGTLDEPAPVEPPRGFEEPGRAEDPVRRESVRAEPVRTEAVEEAPADERPRWDERPQWSDASFREGRPQRPDLAHGDPAPQETARDERPQWSDRQEWRPAEREIPPPHERRRRPAPIPVFTAPQRPPLTGRPTADSLDPESLLRGRRNAPSKGWRRLVYKASGGWIKPGEAPEVRRRRELVTRARTPVTTGHHRVAVLSLKGGVGKTTTTVGLGATLAQMRGDRVIAVDANPDRGTLSDKLVLETSATVRDLLNERDQVKRYVDIRAFTSQAPSRLEVLASDRDPSVSEAFSGADYQAVSQVLENFYSICITDCGTGLLHSAMGGVLGLADQIVLVSSPSVDGARAASATLDWLEAHHYADLVKNATVVLCSVRPRSKSAVDIRKLEAHFAARCRAVIRVPYDPHLEEGAEIDLDRLQEATREAYLQLAASVGDGFAGVRE